MVTSVTSGWFVHKRQLIRRQEVLYIYLDIGSNPPLPPRDRRFYIYLYIGSAPPPPPLMTADSVHTFI